MKKIVLFIALLISFKAICYGAGADPFVAKEYIKGGFPVAVKGKVAAIMVDHHEWPGVRLATKNLQTDLEKVTGIIPELATDKASGMVIIIGTIGKSLLIDGLI
ncbi:MAG: glycosyl hydrolase, partial [Pedobacter sp.]|nr:glycosyl hydrolase [Pedobacter sp.]